MNIDHVSIISKEKVNPGKIAVGIKYALLFVIEVVLHYSNI